MKYFNEQIQLQFNKLCKTGKLFRVAMTGNEVWELYLKSFSNDPTFRDPESSEHNCNHCKNFIRRYGNIVAITEDFKVVSMFNVEAEDEYAPVALALATAIATSPIKDVFFETYQELNSLPYESCSKTASVFRLGINKNTKRYTKEEAEKFGMVKADETKTFNHFHLDLPKQFVDNSGKSVESIMGSYRDDKNVFQRAMQEISSDTLQLIKDLILQGSLLNGTAHLFKIEQILPMKVAYDKLAEAQKDNWCWVTSFGLPFAKFRNEAIGTLCVDLSEGMELNKACQAWNYKVDPVNYMKTTAPITKKQIEESKKFVEENGYVESFSRRFATIDDIKVSEIKHINSGKGEIKEVSIFDSVKATSTRHKRSEFDGVEEVSIEKFMSDILPGCTSVEAMLLNSHASNMVSLTTANIADSKPIFKWDNNYSWTFDGNLAGKSQIKQAVKDAGGKIDGVLMARLVWNDENQDDHSDLDLWCTQPDGAQIGFSTGFRKDSGNRFSSCSGQLDLDDRGYSRGIHVENIYFLDRSQMKPGSYSFKVNQFSAKNSKGFKLEVEYDGEIYTYLYDKRVTGDVNVATVELDTDGKFTIKHKLPCTDGIGISREIYGLESNQFHKVNLVCLSPNHWGNNNVGNKHYLFMLDKCKSPNPIRSFHSENLNADLTKERKVLEVLGSTNMIESTDKQLSGLGFNATVKDELIVKLSGSFKRVIKIKF